MKHIAMLFTLCAAFCACAASTADDISRYESGGQLAADPCEMPVDAPKDMKLILCIGQSNMAGRAKPTDEDSVVVTNAYKLNRDNKWVVAKAPCHFDKKVAAVGPRKGLPAELHVFAKTPHGFGIYKKLTPDMPAYGWPERVYDWLAFMGYAKKGAAE